MSLIDDIHKDLGFSDYEADLRKVPGIWKSISTLQSEVRKSPTNEKKYRAYLSRCIKQLRENDPELKGDAAAEAAAEFTNWLENRRNELGLPGRECLRYPVGVEPWAAKHLPAQYENVCTAWKLAMERTSPRSLAQLRQAYEDMFKAYLDAV